jgi:dolichol kinase
MIWMLGIEKTAYIVLTAACIGILLMHLALAGTKVPGMAEWIKNVGREGETPGEGALYNALGILFAISLLRDHPLAAISVILILALGDGLATFAGTRFGRHRLPWNRSKSLEGTAGFALGASFSWLTMPVAETILIVMLAAIIESLPMKVNDNIVLPVAVSLLYYLAI